MKKALLDANGILIGYSDDMEADGIDVPDGCDLVVGRYRYTDGPAGKAFMPVALGPFAKRADEPDALRAVWLALREIQRKGLVAFPSETVDWIEWFGKSIDGRK